MARKVIVYSRVIIITVILCFSFSLVSVAGDDAKKEKAKKSKSTNSKTISKKKDAKPKRVLTNKHKVKSTSFGKSNKKYDLFIDKNKDGINDRFKSQSSGSKLKKVKKVKAKKPEKKETKKDSGGKKKDK
ncbi:MAG: hypothetical protein GF315_06375 [candidate division Zixibacteria bacterium]|nr:hypothetical protein [candidate division Zixibacteria bacterium]